MLYLHLFAFGRVSWTHCYLVRQPVPAGVTVDKKFLWPTKQPFVDIFVSRIFFWRCSDKLCVLEFEDKMPFMVVQRRGEDKGFPAQGFAGKIFILVNPCFSLSCVCNEIQNNLPSAE